MICSRVLHISVFAACLAGALVPVSAHAQTYNLLYSFTGGADGADPEGQLVRDTKGNLYGVAYDGGFSCTTSGSPAGIGCGTLWKINTLGQFNVLVTFKGANGAIPTGLVLVGDTLYGTTSNGGASDKGTLYKVKTNGSKFTLLHQFTGTDGCNPNRPQIDAAGNVYEAVGCLAGNGGIVRIGADGSFSTLRTEPGSPSTIAVNRIVLDSPDNLIYGSTYDPACTAQSRSCDTLFSLTTNGGNYTTLSSFKNSRAGSFVTITALVDGKLYGLSDEDGETGHGSLFTYDIASTKTKIVHGFTASDGGAPYNAPLVTPRGTVYGASFYGQAGLGSIYTVGKSGNLTTLHEFTDANGTEGDYPSGTLVYDKTSGTIYGTADYGGASGGSGGGCLRPDSTQINPYGCGTVYSLAP